MEDKKLRTTASKSAKEIVLKNRGALLTIEKNLKPLLENLSQ